jgi:hypothetical protein
MTAPHNLSTSDTNTCLRSTGAPTAPSFGATVLEAAAISAAATLAVSSPASRLLQLFQQLQRQFSACSLAAATSLATSSASLATSTATPSVFSLDIAATSATVPTLQHKQPLQSASVTSSGQHQLQQHPLKQITAADTAMLLNVS